jgi:hypothetical protein
MWVSYEYLMNLHGTRTGAYYEYMWMIRAIHERADDRGFPADVAQRGGKNCPVLGLVKITYQRLISFHNCCAFLLMCC